MQVVFSESFFLDNFYYLLNETYHVLYTKNWLSFDVEIRV